MKKHLRSILTDKLAALAQLLAADPSLARHSAPQDEFVPSIPHWLYRGDTALHLCAAGLRLEAARLLLQHGADVNAVNRRGATPLHYACDPRPTPRGVWNPSRQGRLLDLLLHNGANPNRADKSGVTPLHRAVRARSPTAVRHLLRAGANANARTKRGSTPAQMAAHNTGAEGTAGTSTFQAEIVKLLREFNSSSR